MRKRLWRLARFYIPVLALLAYAVLLGVARSQDPNGTLAFVLAMIALAAVVTITVVALETVRRNW